MLKISYDAMRTTLTCHLGFLSLLVHWDSTSSSSSWRWFVFECSLHWMASVSIQSFDASSKCFLSDPFLYFSFQGCSQIYIEMVLENSVEIHSLSLCYASLPSICVVVNKLVGSQTLRGLLKLMSIPFQWIKCIQAYFSLSLVNQLQNMCKYENWVVEGHFSILFHNKMLTCKWNTLLWTFYIYVMARWIWI